MDRFLHYTNDGGPLYFYGGWLSSFANYPFVARPMPPITTYFPGPVSFRTREHWFAAHKTLDVRHFSAILKVQYPREAKSMGRIVRLRPSWDDGLAFATMLEGIRLQIAQHPDLLEKLAQVGPRIIAEDSPTDFIWGIRDKDGGIGGRNLLGKAWMAARDEIT